MAAVIATLAVSLAQSNDRIRNLETALREPTQAAVDAAFVTPGHRTVDLRGTDGRDLGQFVLLPSGEGFLVRSSLQPAPAGRTYELWAVVKGTPIAVGLMGSTPTAVAFTVASAPAPSVLAVTVEPQAGSTRPTSAPVATATV